MDLIDRLRNFEVSDDLGNGDFSLLREAAARLRDAEAGRDRLREAARYMARVWVLPDDDPQTLDAVDACVERVCKAVESRKKAALAASLNAM